MPRKWPIREKFRDLSPELIAAETQLLEQTLHLEIARVAVAG
jgi:hypothetical protein